MSDEHDEALDRLIQTVEGFVVLIAHTSGHG